MSQLHQGTLLTEPMIPQPTDRKVDDIFPALAGLDAYEENSQYTTHSESYAISFIEFALLNEYFYNTYRKPTADLAISDMGLTDSIGRISYGGSFAITQPWWFRGYFPSEINEFFFQTKIYMDGSKAIITELYITSKKGVTETVLEDVFKRVKKLAFNNSKYVGKCIKVKLREGSFNGIEIIDMSNYKTDLILTEAQEKYIRGFINRVSRGSSTRYLFNGEPGTGKTESIRDIIRALTPNVTFIIPEFKTTEDLTVILEACEIFTQSVIIMDDIDLFLGSRDKGSYTMLLGQFLSFFDGVKKRKISLLASTNDKGLVDKAAERPGRFNLTLDYTFLTATQIAKVCDIHLPVEYHTQEIYDVLTGSIDGKKANITGAFIANLAENIREMAEDDENWSIEDTKSLIKESYKGFYSSQTNPRKSSGFDTD